MEEEKNKPQTFSADGWMGNQRSSQILWRNEQEILSPEPRTTRTSELNGSGGGRGKGIRGPRPFVLVGATNRDKRPPFCPGRCLQPGQNSLAPLSPSLSPRPSHSAHLFLLFLARERGVLAWERGAKGLELVFLFFLGLYSSFHALEIEKMCSWLISWTFKLHM